MAIEYTVACKITTPGASQSRAAIKGVSDEVRTLKSLFAGYLSAGTLLQTLKLADTYATMLNRLRVVTDNQYALNRAMTAMHEISLDTRSSLQSNVEMYARTAINTKQLGIEQERLIGFTKSLRQAMALSGVTAREADWGMIQLSQGMSAGALRGDELRSVMEQLPVVADVLAKSMGVTRGELRYLAFQSKVTTQVMIKAFEDARVELEERFAKRIPTLSEGVSVLGTAVLRYVGQSDQAIGVTRNLAALMQSAARNANILAPAFLGVAAGLLTLIIRLTAVKALLAVGAGGWLVAAIVGASVAVVALISHWDDFRILVAQTRDHLDSLGVPIDAFISKLDSLLGKWTQARNWASKTLAEDPIFKSLGTTVLPGTAGKQGVTKISGMGPHEKAVRDSIAAREAATKTAEVLNKAWQPTVEQQAWFAQLQKPLDDYLNRLEAIEGFSKQLVTTQEILTKSFLEGKLSQQEYNQEMGTAEVRLRILKTATDELIKSTNDNAEANRQAYVEGLKSLQAYQRASAELWLKQTEGATDAMTGQKRGFTELWLEATNDAQMAQDTIKNAFKGMEDALVEFVTTGKLDFRSLITSMLADLTRFVYRKYLLAPLMGGNTAGNAGDSSGLLGFLKLGASFLGATASSPGGSSYGALDTNQFGNYEAMSSFYGYTNGGAPTVNRPVWVGENGPEIFTPSQAGTVTPAPQSAAAASPNVTVINVSTMAEALAAMRSTEGQRIILNAKV